MPRDVLWAVLAKSGVLPHLICVNRRMNTELKVNFDLNGEPVAVPCSGGAVKQGCPLYPGFFLLAMQACLESLDRAMPVEAKPLPRTNNTRMSTNGGKAPGTAWSN